MKKVMYGLAFVAILLIGSSAAFWIYASGHGASKIDWSVYRDAKIAFDAQGIPTIEATNWESLVEAQGYVTAADRLFQMELMRRAASGGLSEWLGEATYVYDVRRKREDWPGVAAQAVKDLPADEKRFCDVYARGVNRFVQDYPGYVGLEYKFLRTAPATWTCQDTLLILMSMAEDLSASSAEEPARAQWNAHLRPSWQDLLFTQNHPWNIPLFGTRETLADFPPPADFVPVRPLSDEEKKIPPSAEEDLQSVGSNNWAYRNQGSTLLANDPHLSLNVPILWYAIRLRISAKEWVVGESIPGLPGVVLGMNPSAAWAFTNLNEDVDDLLLEELSKDGKNYVASVNSSGEKVYRPIEERHTVLKVKGGKDRDVVARFTHRGPLHKYLERGDDVYSRQWLAFKPGKLRLPNLKLAQFRNWEEFNTALDDMLIPAQNVLYADRHGNLGYRSSGTGVIRKVSGFVPQRALEGEWLGFEESAKRLRFYKPLSETKINPEFFATANQRIYMSKFGQYWTGDLRAERIREALSASNPLDVKGMEDLQRDTKSRIDDLVVKWVAKNANAVTADEQRVVAQWKTWDGFAEHQPDVFTQAEVVRRVLRDLLVERVRSAFLPAEGPPVAYKWRMDSAWLIRVMERPDGIQAFGLETPAVAQYLLERIARNAKDYSGGYQERNRWRAQHPLTRIPVIGNIFRVKEYPQVGYRDLVRLERPAFGAGTRLVWDLSHPEKSTWITPVGQSGHALTRHFKDLQADWFSGKTYPVLDPAYQWE